jgi:hypothetical protein
MTKAVIDLTEDSPIKSSSKSSGLETPTAQVQPVAKLSYPLLVAFHRASREQIFLFLKKSCEQNLDFRCMAEQEFLVENEEMPSDLQVLSFLFCHSFSIHLD